MPPGRRFSLGGACTPSHAPHLQHLLPVYREWDGSRGSIAGGVSAGVPYTRKLSVGAWRVCDVAHQRYTQLADRSLPALEAGSLDRFTGRRHAGGGEQGVGRATARRAVVARRIEFASAIGFGQAFAGLAGSSDLAGLATTGVCGDSASSGGPGRDREVADQSRKD